MSNPFTKSRSKSRVRLPQQTEEEQRAIELALQNIEGSVGTQADFQTLLSSLAEPLLANLIAGEEGGTGALSEFDLERQAIADAATQASSELLRDQLALIRGGGIATADELAAINEAANRAIDLERSNIERATGLALERLAEEVAPARGLRASDTPIVALGEDVTQEGIRQLGDIVSAIRGQEAEAGLRFPLERLGQVTAQAGRSQELADRIAEFERGLELDSLLARANLLGQVGGLTTGTSELFDPLRLVDLLQRERISQPKGEGSFTPSIHQGLIRSAEGLEDFQQGVGTGLSISSGDVFGV